MAGTTGGANWPAEVPVLAAGVRVKVTGLIAGEWGCPENWTDCPENKNYRNGQGLHTIYPFAH